MITSPFTVVYQVYSFESVKPSMHLMNKFYLILVYDTFYVLLSCWLVFLKLRIFAHMFIRYTSLIFSFLVVFFYDVSIKLMLAL